MNAGIPSNAWQTTAILAGAWLRSKLGRKTTEATANRYIIEALATLGPGLPAKAAQLLGAAKSTAVVDFQHLALPLSEVQAMIAAELPEFSTRIQSLGPTALPASLGQVHAATLHGGERVAIKIQYPEIEGQIKAQLASLMKAAGLASKVRGSSLAHESYLGYFHAQLLEELNYLGEAERQNRFRADLSSIQQQVVPEAYRHWSSPRILVQQWVDSTSLDEASSLNASERSNLVETLIDSTLRQVFYLNELHADLHPGNIGLQTNGCNLVLFDFGSTLKLSPSHVSVLGEVITALRRGTRFDAVEAFCALGFSQAPLLAMADKLRSLWRIFLGPFVTAGNFDAEMWSFGERSKDLLGSQRMSFRMAGPPWFLLLMRTFAGVATSWRRLQGTFDANSLVEQYLNAKATNFKDAAISEVPLTRPTDRLLRVRILENGEEIVSLQMPGAAVANLEDIVPESAHDALVQLGYDLAALRVRAQESDLAPQVLFELVLNGRTIKVWLE